MNICDDCINRMRLEKYDVNIDYKNCPYLSCPMKKIVLCKNCGQYYAYTNAKQGYGLCVYFMHETTENGFCNVGKKRDD